MTIRELFEDEEFYNGYCECFKKLSRSPYVDSVYIIQQYKNVEDNDKLSYIDIPYKLLFNILKNKILGNIQWL